jgi:hypothetical protein
MTPQRARSFASTRASGSTTSAIHIPHWQRSFADPQKMLGAIFRGRGMREAAPLEGLLDDAGQELGLVGPAGLEPATRPL